jgi:hypothetical protein
LLGAFFSLAFLFANKVSSTVCNVSNFVLTASDMSDLSYEQELGEVGEGGEVDEGPLQHCRKLTT